MSLSVILSLLEKGLSLWEHKDKTKYVDKVMKLKREYREEMAKPEDQRSGAVLDNIEFELRLLAGAFTSSV